MKNLHIENSYRVWSVYKMLSNIVYISLQCYSDADAEKILNRTYRSMFIEWWLHNIGYYITRPFCGITKIERLNLRFKDVDLNEWK